MKKRYAAVSVLAVGILALSFGVPLALGSEYHSAETPRHNGIGGAMGLANDHDKDGSDHDANETDHGLNESQEAQLNVSGAAGGGWFVGYQGTSAYTITFGMFITTNQSLSAYNEFVLQGRNLSERIQSMNFTKVELVNHTLDAWGWCRANGVSGYWFHLKATDGGMRSKDMLSLAVFKDTNNNTQMDETTPTWQWMANGLDGGNIVVGSFAESRDAEGEDTDQDSND